MSEGHPSLSSFKRRRLRQISTHSPKNTKKNPKNIDFQGEWGTNFFFLNGKFAPLRERRWTSNTPAPLEEVVFRVWARVDCRIRTRIWIHSVGPLYHSYFPNFLSPPPPPLLLSSSPPHHHLPPPDRSTGRLGDNSGFERSRGYDSVTSGLGSFYFLLSTFYVSLPFFYHLLLLF